MRHLVEVSVALLVGAVLFVACCGGCWPHAEQRTKNAVSEAGYALALDACINEGRDAGNSMAAYQACAARVDAQYGRR